MKTLPTVAIVTTGGTIAEKEGRDGAVPALTGEELVSAVPGLDRIANVRVVNFSNIDSAQMSPEVWSELSAVVDDQLDDPTIVGAVVVHGTDTMEEAAYFLDLTLRSDKPVVCVGAMRASCHLSPDGPGNIYNGVLQAVSREGREWGVTVTLNDRIHAARYVRKAHTANVATFDSGERGALGYIANDRVYRYQGRPQRNWLSVPERLADVYYIATYAGTDGSLIRFAVDAGADGLVVEGYGAGNVNEAAYEEVKRALAKGVTVVVTSRVGLGPTAAVYGSPGGGVTLERAGAFVGSDLSGVKARLLMMIALPQLGSEPEWLSLFL
jgi:L-asparaginase